MPYFQRALVVESDVSFTACLPPHGLIEASVSHQQQVPPFCWGPADLHRFCLLFQRPMNQFNEATWQPVAGSDLDSNHLDPTMGQPRLELLLC